jgi:N6-adenosine-specific RNA methylase IME4
MSKTNGHARSASSGPRNKTRASSPARAGRGKPAGPSAGKEMDRRVERGHDVGANGMADLSAAAGDLLRFANARRFATFLVDPPWRFTNKTGKVAPEHKRLARYGTMTLPEIMALPVEQLAAPTAHLYLWCPNALLPDGIAVMKAWGFTYKSNIVWHKVRKDGGSDGRGVGFYFRNVTEIVLFGVRGKNARTLAPGRRQVNLLATRKREHSRKPDEQYAIIESCSPGPYLELFARGARPKWTGWGNEAATDYHPTWCTYAYNSTAEQAVRV